LTEFFVILLFGILVKLNFFDSINGPSTWGLCSYYAKEHSVGNFVWTISFLVSFKYLFGLVSGNHIKISVIFDIEFFRTKNTTVKVIYQHNQLFYIRKFILFLKFIYKLQLLYISSLNAGE